MAKGIPYILRRCRQEGLRNGCRLVIKRLRRPFYFKWLRRKYTNYRVGLPLTSRRIEASAEPTFFVTNQNDNNEFNTYKNVYVAEIKTTLAIANRICQHDFVWLCPNCPRFDNGIRWHDNFFDHRQWPLDFYLDMDYSSDARLGDVRQVWELNRHQYFVTLAKAHLLTGDKIYVSEFKAQLSDWVDKNPVGYGINWLHAQEVALRAVAWTWSFHLLKSALDDDFKEFFLSMIYAHAEYVEYHLSDRTVTHNHLVSEVCGLALIGLMYPNFKRSEKWREKGIKIFFREVLKQIWEDGLSGELSTNYHCFVLDSFLQLYILLLKNGIRVPKEVTVRIERMVEAVMFMLRPDGRLPLIGDCDSGRAFRLTEYRMWDRRAYLSIGAVLFGRGDFKAVAGKFHEEAFWLLGEAGLYKYEQLQVNAPTSHDKMFTPGGLAIFRSSWEESSEQLLVRGGPTMLRSGVGTTHNHADFLSFEFYTKGRPILVDPGVYLYGQDDDWRFFYRKTLAHNTISVDGVDHLDVSSTRFGIPHLPVSTLHNYQVDGDWVMLDMSHSGYSDYGISHRRQFNWQKNRCLAIFDHLGGYGVHRVEQYFHFSPELKLLVEDSKIIVLAPCGERLLDILLSANDFCLAVDVVNGQTEGHLQGWVSEKYGEKKAANVARIVYEGELPVKMITVFAEVDGLNISALCNDMTNRIKGY